MWNFKVILIVLISGENIRHSKAFYTPQNGQTAIVKLLNKKFDIIYLLTQQNNWKILKGIQLFEN